MNFMKEKEVMRVKAEMIIKSSGENYNIRDYVGDIIQFILYREVLNIL